MNQYFDDDEDGDGDGDGDDDDGDDDDDDDDDRERVEAKVLFSPGWPEGAALQEASSKFFL